MSAKLRSRRETFPAMDAQKGGVARVDSEMRRQVTFPLEGQIAIGTGKRPHVCVVLHMSGKLRFVLKRFPALRAGVGPLVRVTSLVSYK